MRFTRAPLVTLAILVVMTGCSLTTPSPRAASSVEPGAAVRGEDRGGDFVLTIGTDRAVFPAMEPIDVTTSLAYLGDAEFVDLWGSGGGLVGFDVRQVDGTFETFAAMTDDCAPHRVFAREPAAIPFQKSGSWDPQDPDSAAMEAFLRDPLLRLPPGTWEITAWARFLVGECALPEVNLRASIVIESE